MSPQSGVHYVALAAKYCYDDPASVQALRRLLAGLREKGWSRAYLGASGISVPFPSDIEGLSSALANMTRVKKNTMRDSDYARLRLCATQKGDVTQELTKDRCARRFGRE